MRIGATDHYFLYGSASYRDDTVDGGDWFARRRARRSIVGHDTWIGHAAQVKSEVTLGHGAVFASGATVIRDVAPYTIVAGVPARPIRCRQPPEIAARLIALAWWDLDRLRAAFNDFRALTADAFLERYES